MKYKAIVRHILTALGGILLTMGHFDESIIEGTIGGIMTLYGVVLSLYDKNKYKDNDKEGNK